jgi:hypothetical protein
VRKIENFDRAIKQKNPQTLRLKVFDSLCYRVSSLEVTTIDPFSL